MLQPGREGPHKVEVIDDLGANKSMPPHEKFYACCTTLQRGASLCHQWDPIPSQQRTCNLESHAAAQVGMDVGAKCTHANHYNFSACPLHICDVSSKAAPDPASEVFFARVGHVAWYTEAPIQAQHDSLLHDAPELNCAEPGALKRPAIWLNGGAHGSHARIEEQALAQPMLFKCGAAVVEDLVAVAVVCVVVCAVASSYGQAIARLGAVDT
eukprot:7391976-Prymnesium_polylepis.1